jgi:glycosyltransferase involved in cell wall biosynthesis
LISLGIAEKIYVAALHSHGTLEEETIDGSIFVKRFKLKMRGLSRNFFIQLIKYLELTGKLLKYFSGKNIGMINIHSFSLLPLGVLLKWRLKSFLVYDAHELETEQVGGLSFRKSISKIAERMFIHCSDMMIVVSDSIADWYVAHYKIQRPYVVKNTPPYRDKIEKHNKFRTYFNIPSEKKIFLYQGGLMAGRGIELLLETFKTSHVQSVVLVFMGYGPMENMVKEAAKDCDAIYYLPAVSPDVLLDYTSSADYGIHVIFNTCLNHNFCLPNKLFEYMMAEIPVVVSNVKEMAQLVLENNIGVVIKDLDPPGLVDAVNKVQAMNYAELQANIKEVKKNYSWEAQEQILASAYQELLGNKKGAK